MFIDFHRFSSIFIDLGVFLGRGFDILWQPVAACGGLWRRSWVPFRNLSIRQAGQAGRQDRQGRQAGQAGQAGRPGKQAGRAGRQAGQAGRKESRQAPGSPLKTFTRCWLAGGF